LNKLYRPVRLTVLVRCVHCPRVVAGARLLLLLLLLLIRGDAVMKMLRCVERHQQLRRGHRRQLVIDASTSGSLGRGAVVAAVVRPDSTTAISCRFAIQQVVQEAGRRCGSRLLHRIAELLTDTRTDNKGHLWQSRANTLHGIMTRHDVVNLLQAFNFNAYLSYSSLPVDVL